MTDKEKVLAVWPDANIHKVGPHWAIYNNLYSWQFRIISAWCVTSELAWADAASRLPKQEPLDKDNGADELNPALGYDHPLPASEGASAITPKYDYASSETEFFVNGIPYPSREAAEIAQEFAKPTPPATGEGAKVASDGNWISIKDRLPAIGVKVLTFTPPQERWGHVSRYFCTSIVKYEGKRDFTWFDCDINQWITHWQPLPDEPNAVPAPKPGEAVEDVELPPLELTEDDRRRASRMAKVIFDMTHDGVRLDTIEAEILNLYGRERQLKEALATIHSERALRIEAEKGWDIHCSKVMKELANLTAYHRNCLPQAVQNNLRDRAEVAEAKLADLVAENHSLKSALSAVGMENVVIATEKEDANGK